MRHDANLSILFLEIVLIDADGIDPEQTVRSAPAEEVKAIE